MFVPCICTCASIGALFLLSLSVSQDFVVVTTVYFLLLNCCLSVYGGLLWRCLCVLKFSSEAVFDGRQKSMRKRLGGFHEKALKHNA